MFCKLCSKHFNTANAFANHLNSKKHKELLDESAKTSETTTQDSFAVKGDRNAKKAEQAHKAAEQAAENMVEEAEEGDEKDWEDVDEEDIGSIGD